MFYVCLLPVRCLLPSSSSLSGIITQTTPLSVLKLESIGLQLTTRTTLKRFFSGNHQKIYCNHFTSFRNVLSSIKIQNKNFPLISRTAFSLKNPGIITSLTMPMSRTYSKISNENQQQQQPQQQQQSIIVRDITKNLIYFSTKPKDIDRNTLKFKDETQKTFVIIISWLFASKDHLKKYAKIYTDLGFDVIAITITPWQLLWPMNGTQLIADDVLRLLDQNSSLFKSMIIHGFSVGGYVFGEIMYKMKDNLKKYEPILNNVHAQIWDSAADITEIPHGFPAAVFPKSPKLQKLFRNYVNYHMKRFYDQATIHYMNSSQIFHNTLVMAPALFLLSKNDPIGAEKSNLSVKNDWEAKGIKCTWKCWNRSKHVLHYKYHSDEYIKLLMEHLNVNVLQRNLEYNNKIYKAKL